MNGGEHEAVQENDEPKEDLRPESETDFFATMAADGLQLRNKRRGKGDRDDSARRWPGYCIPADPAVRCEEVDTSAVKILIPRGFALL